MGRQEAKKEGLPSCEPREGRFVSNLVNHRREQRSVGNLRTATLTVCCIPTAPGSAPCYQFRQIGIPLVPKAAEPFALDRGSCC